MKKNIVFSIILISISCESFAQTKLTYYDPEPFKFCLMPLQPFRYLEYLIPYYKSENETEEEFQKEVLKRKKENERIAYENRDFDKKYAAYVVDSINYANCIQKWQNDILAWRKRNPNWSKNSKYKNDINVVPVKIQNVVQAIVGEKYRVTSQTLNLRTGAGKNFTLIQSLNLDDELTLLNSNNTEWWYVDYNGIKGYVFSQYLKIDPYSSWEKKDYQSGATPECENVSPKYNYLIDNYLKINVGNNTDVVIKLMQIGYNGDECIRIVYVRSGDIYHIKNIPEGKYYLKIAYGKDYRQKIINNQCYVKFIKNAQYEKGSEVLNFYKIKKPNQTIGNSTYESWDVPNFELSLDVITTSKLNTFNSNKINEVDFNK